MPVIEMHWTARHMSSLNCSSHRYSWSMIWMFMILKPKQMYCAAFIKNVQSQQDQDEGCKQMPEPVDAFLNKGMQRKVFRQHTPSCRHDQKGERHRNLPGNGQRCKEWKIDADVISTIGNGDGGDGYDRV